jgi:hypothetical protein
MTPPPDTRRIGALLAPFPRRAATRSGDGTLVADGCHRNEPRGSRLSTTPSPVEDPSPLAWDVLAATWLLAQGLLGRRGIRLGGDSGRYLEAAALLVRGEWPRDRAASYLGYELFLAIFTGSGLGLPGVVTAQVVLSGIAAYGLYRLASRLYDARTGWLAALLYVAYPEIQVWNFYVLTDSVFVSMVVVSVSLLSTTHGAWRRGGALLVTLVASTVRPHGVILLPAVTAYGAWTLLRTRSYVRLGALALLMAAVAPAALGILGRRLGHEHLVEQYARGTVIWEYSGLTVPGDLSPRVAATTNPFLQVLAFAWEHPARLGRLALLRLGFEYLHVRPYYSWRHNAFLLATLLPAYALALLGLRRQAAVPGVRVLLLSVIAFQSLAIALTFADWDGRHLLPILPFVFVFAAAGWWPLWERGLGALRGAVAQPRAPV